jgi:uncharacterized RmlC-like cupin family protein
MPANREETPMDVLQASTRFVVKGTQPVTSAQGSRYEPGISAETVGACGLFLGTVTLLPGQRTKAHVHHHESAHCMIGGEAVELWTGHRLEQCSVARPGDYLYIPAGLPHVAVNRSAVPAVFVGARNQASVHEAADMRPDLEGLVP